MVIARGGRPGGEELASGAESKMVRRHAWFHRREDENLLIAVDFENRPAAVADVEVFIGIEGDSGGRSHALCVERAVAIRSHAIDGAFQAAGALRLHAAVAEH